jgi:hypothetical protein
MKTYLKLFKNVLYGVALGVALIVWGYANDGIIRIVSGIIIILVSFNFALDSFECSRKIKLWKTENSGRIIFFYPAKKQVQQEIEKHIVPLLPKDVLSVYYDGPTLVGDIETEMIRMLRYNFDEIKINSPSVFKIVEDQIYLEPLPELKKYNAEMKLASILEKVDKIIKA